MQRRFPPQGIISKTMDRTYSFKCHQPAHTHEYSFASRFPSFTNEEALSSELAGYYFLAMEKKDMALQYFLHAHERYHEWGAFAKCNALFEFVQVHATKSVLSINDNEAIDARNQSAQEQEFALMPV
jgi:hypothetical protein